MWLCHNKGLFSIVDYIDPKNPSKKSGEVLVRSRHKDHIPDVFPEYADDMVYTPNNDYAYRIRVKKEEVAKKAHSMIMDIDYSNFKNSVGSNALRKTYGNFWQDAVRPIHRA